MKRKSNSFIWATFFVSPLVLALLSRLSDVVWEIFNFPPGSRLLFYISYGCYVLFPNLGVLLLLVGTYFTLIAWKNRKSDFEKYVLVFYQMVLLVTLVYDCWWYSTFQQFDSL